MENQTTVLIVDDEPAGREALEGVLFTQGYNLIFAENGQDAFDKALEYMPDVILLDVMMPNMDGFEVCRMMRKDNLLAEIPILMVTALDDRSSKIKGIEAGADDFISKPFDRVELRARIRTITRLNRYRRIVLERVQFAWVVEQTHDGYLVLDPHDHILYANPASRDLFHLPADGEIQEPFRDIVARHYQCEPEEYWQPWPNVCGFPLFLIHSETLDTPAVWLSVEILELPMGGQTKRMVRINEVSQKLALQRDIHYFNRLITHKMRTPIAQMVMAADLIYQQALRKNYEVIEDLSDALICGAKRLGSEVEEILQHLNIPNITKTGSCFPISELEKRVQSICDELGVNQASVQIVPSLSRSSLSLSERAMDVILREVIENAQKFHPRLMPDLTVSVLKGDQNQLHLKIMDDGIYLSPEDLRKVWLPYYQVEKEFTGEINGMGLGLSNIANLVWEVGGKCRISNREDRPGVVVDFVLPTVSIDVPC